MATTSLTAAVPKRFVIKPDALARSVALLLAMAIIQRVAGFGRSILLCRWLAREQLGHWDLTLAFLELAAPIAILSLPACFGRYVEHYRQDGHLRTFIKRTAVAILLLTACSALVLYAGRRGFSYLLYGERESVALVWLLMAALPATIVFNAINELFNGLRMFRMLSLLQFAQSMLFAGLAVGLTLCWRTRADGVIAAWGLTCALCSVLPLYWLIRMWSGLPRAEAAPPHAAFWGKVLPFVSAVWVSNLLGNLFMMADRYMILHHSGMGPNEAAAAVGQYHSARMVPLLVIQLSAIVGTMFVPYFSCDWEAGRRHVVRAQLNLFLKLIGLMLIATGVVILAVAPVLFVGVFKGKFPDGQAILPWLLLAAVWFSMFCVAKSYLWCDERVSHVSLALAVGLGVNVGVNWFLLPLWGIRGAAMSAALANLVLLAMGYGLIARRGMRVTFGTVLVSAAPAAFCFGPWISLASLAILMAISAATPLVFQQEEKEQLVAFARDHLRRIGARGEGRGERGEGRGERQADKGTGEPRSATESPRFPVSPSPRRDPPVSPLPPGLSPLRAEEQA
jgi:O-antigen/teichoic acid export membrane protein